MGFMCVFGLRYPDLNDTCIIIKQFEVLPCRAITFVNPVLSEGNTFVHVRTVHVCKIQAFRKF